MALIRWQPREAFAFHRDLLDTWTGYGAGWHPRVDVAESEHDFTVHAELPGIRKEDIQVTLEDNTLTIEGERKCEDEQRDKQFYRRERALRPSNAPLAWAQKSIPTKLPRLTRMGF